VFVSGALVPLCHIYFLGVAYRLEIETPDRLILRSRTNKEEFRRCNFTVGQAVSFAVTHFRILPQEGSTLSHEAKPGAPITRPLTP